jgi:DNA topoisomerase-6 subunit B
LREMKLAIQECGRKLAAHLRARENAERELKRRGLFERYIPEVAAAISAILGVPKEKVEKPFFKALPNFVRYADEANGRVEPAVPSPPREPAPPGQVKGKKGRGEQLTLVE